MRMLFMSLLLALGLASMAPAIAGPLEDARAAYLAGNYAEAVQILRPIAEQGNALAQATLGDMYYLGDRYYVMLLGDRYFEMLREAPNQFVEAMRLQRYYWGAPKDYAEAARWYQLAAEQGDAWAQRLLGDMYYLGRGVPRDYVQAHMWFNLAAAQGDTDAVRLRDDVATSMMPDQIAEAQKLAWEWAEAHP